jgi:hypothetical protein
MAAIHDDYVVVNSGYGIYFHMPGTSCWRIGAVTGTLRKSLRAAVLVVALWSAMIRKVRGPWF